MFKSGCFISKSTMGWLCNTITARPEPILLFGSSIASEGSNRRQIDKQNKHYSCLVILKTFVAALMRKLLMLPAPHSNRPTWVFTASCCVICHNNLIVLLAQSSIHNTMESNIYESNKPSHTINHCNRRVASKSKRLILDLNDFLVPCPLRQRAARGSTRHLVPLSYQGI